MGNSLANVWICSNDTGISSKTIWAVMMGAVRPGQQGSSLRYDVPQDPSDFGRCYRLLQIAPEWRERLGEVADMFPKWKPMVDAWHELEQLYVLELPSGKAPKLYERMRQLVDEGRVLDGWKQTSPGSWTKQL